MGKQIIFDFARELEIQMIVLTTTGDSLASRLTAQLVNMVARGMSEEQVLNVLQNDLDTGGKLFAGIRNTFRNVNGAIVDDVAQEAIQQVNSDSDEWEWITTSGEPCVDCYPRHGKVKTWKQWESEGLPRSGFSVCDQNCKCELVPATQVPHDFGGMVEVKSLTQYRKEFKEKLKTDEALQKEIEDYKAALKNKKA